MARKLKIQAQQTKTIAEAFSDFLLCKKALGVSDKTLKTYSQHFSAVCKYLDSSAPIAGLFKRPLDEMIEQMRSSNLKDNRIRGIEIHQRFIINHARGIQAAVFLKIRDALFHDLVEFVVVCRVRCVVFNTKQVLHDAFVMSSGVYSICLFMN